MSQRLTRQTSAVSEPARETLQALGQALRDARQARGEDLYEVASYLRIKPSYLYALEQGDLGLTPGRPYALGFLRSYAEYLGFDGNDVVQHVKHALDSTALSQPLNYRTPIAESTRPSGFLIGISIIAAAAIYGAWHVYFRNEPVIERVASVPGELGRIASGILELDETRGRTGDTSQARHRPGPPSPSPAPTSGPATVGQSPEGPAAGSPVAGPAPGPAGSGRSQPGDMAVASTVVQAPLPQHPTSGSGPESMPASPDRSVSESERIGSSAPEQMGHTGPAVGEGQKEPVVADRATPEPAAAPPPPDIAAASAQPVPTRELLAALGAEATEDGTDAGRVTLLAHEPSWIQVRSNDREFLRTKTLEAGERFPLPNRADLALWTGNAGGLEIIVDGRSIGMLGARGRVLKDVSLAPDALRSRLDTVAR